MDWTLVRFTEEPTLIATIQFDNGITLVARCMDDVYDVIVSGIPDAPSGVVKRSIGLRMGDDATDDTTVWSVGAKPDTAFSRLPAMVARRLAEGGKLQIIIPSDREGGPRTRYVMELDPSSRAIERTLTACGRPLTDVRDKDREGDGDDGLPPNIEWARQPEIQYPESVRGRIPRLGYVALSCVVGPEGRLTECQTESEQPRAYNLGLAVQRGLGRARLKQTREGAAAGLPFEGQLIVFTVNFRLE